MSLTLTVDGERWRGHLRRTATALPGLVPVAKGNGYGFTLGRLARRAHWLGVDTIAVGTYHELDDVAARFPGSLLVLSPWRPFTPRLSADLSRRVIHTVGRPSDLPDLLARDPQARIVLERRTSMLRHGLAPGELAPAVRVLAAAGQASGEGVAIHLPLSSGTGGAGSHLAEVHRLMREVAATDLVPRTVWVSHLDTADLTQLRSAYPDFSIRPRVGTTLWLGARDALAVTATVLDSHRIERGDPFGYRGRAAPRSGHIVIVSGGTAHGIGLESPTGELSLRARASTIARGGMDALGFVRSPFTIDGKQRLFAEPPHMQASMLFLPDNARVPVVGEQVAVRVRQTATTFDRIVIS
ncbi:MAG: alanine racemase [Nocardioides sp.]